MAKDPMQDITKGRVLPGAVAELVTHYSTAGPRSRARPRFFAGTLDCPPPFPPPHHPSFPPPHPHHSLADPPPVIIMKIGHFHPHVWHGQGHGNSRRPTPVIPAALPSSFPPQRESRDLSPIQPGAGLQEWFGRDIDLSTRRVLVGITVSAHESRRMIRALDSRGGKQRRGGLVTIERPCGSPPRAVSPVPPPKLCPTWLVSEGMAAPPGRRRRPWRSS